MTTHRLAERSLDAPPFIEAGIDRYMPHPCHIGQFLNCPDNATHDKTPRAPRVVHLVDACCPSTIARLVVAVVVDALNGMPQRWSWPHVGQEVFKFKPSITDANASPTVVLKLVRVWIKASILHHCPAAKLRTARLAVACIVATVRKLVPAEASAGLGIAGVEIAHPYHQFATAVASNNASTFALRVVAQYHQPPKTSMIHEIKISTKYIFNTSNKLRRIANYARFVR